MVLIMNTLKAKRIVRCRGQIKDADYEMEGSAQEKGYDSDTQDEADEDEVYVVKGSSNRATKKRRAVCHSDSDKESDFVEDLLRDYKKKAEYMGKRVKSSLGKRDSSSSDEDVTLACNLDKKRHPSRHPDKELGGKRASNDEDS